MTNETAKKYLLVFFICGIIAWLFLYNKATGSQPIPLYGSVLLGRIMRFLLVSWFLIYFGGCFGIGINFFWNLCIKTEMWPANLYTLFIVVMAGGILGIFISPVVLFRSLIQLGKPVLAVILTTPMFLLALTFFQ